MTQKRELRVRIGSPDGPRSSGWKIWVRKSDIYIASRIAGEQLKVSLHASGDCQFSLTSKWAERTERPNKDRHIQKWAMRPFARPNQAIHAFRIVVPQSELRTIVPRENPTTELCWYAAPPLEHATYVEVYVTPRLDYAPREFSAPFDLLGVLPLENSSFVAIFAHHLQVEPEDVSQLAALKEQASTSLFPVRRTTRGWGFAETLEGLHSLVEFAPVPEDPAA